jgi:ribonucleoside-diphosphate reductase alpha chain
LVWADSVKKQRPMRRHGFNTMKGQNVDFRSGDERADLSQSPLMGADDAAVLTDNKEAGKSPAMPMNDKTDMATADLLTAEACDGRSAQRGGGGGFFAQQPEDTKRVDVRRFEIKTDPSRDALLTDFGKETLDDRYLLPGETYQDLFARVADAYADDPDHAQRLYDYISKLWFMPATPVLSNGGTGRGLPISCYLNTVEDSLEGIVKTWNENVWLASRGAASAPIGARCAASARTSA